MCCGVGDAGNRGGEGRNVFSDFFISDPTHTASSGIVVAAVVVTAASVLVVRVITNDILVSTGWELTLFAGPAVCFEVAYLLALVALNISSAPLA